MTTAKKSTGTKGAANKSPLEKTASKAASKKSVAKKSAAKKAAARRYSPAASANVEREMKAMKAGKLKSGSGAKVTNPKQAIAIALSEARRAGKKMPSPPATD